MNSKKKNLAPPPETASFWELFDYAWDHGLGNDLTPDGEPTAWTALQLEAALDSKPDMRSVESWRSRKHLPSREHIRKLCWIISGGAHSLRKAWSDAMIAAWRQEKLNRSKEAKPQGEIAKQEPLSPVERQKRPGLKVASGVVLACIAIAAFWFATASNSEPAVTNIRICDKYFFDMELKKCSKHVSVLVHGVEEVFLSFDFENVPDGTPFERWWIRNGERVAGRTSFNDAAWPGYTFWRPGGPLQVGQYVVRLVVDGNVETQAFYVQEEGFTSES